MDLCLSGKRGIVCAASKGLGHGIAFALAREGVDLVINARDESALNATIEQIHSETGVSVVTVAGDITTERVQDKLLAACAEPDILINNARSASRGFPQCNPGRLDPGTRCQHAYPNYIDTPCD
jgi:3-oxoacyl-[acyl-carrier protein] reductase